MLLVDAMYVNKGGGRALLMELLRRLSGVRPVTVLKDPRLPAFSLPGVEAAEAGSGEAARLRFYRRHGDGLSRVLCFGNVPPPLRLRAEVGVYFHNMALLQDLLAGGPLSAVKMAYVRWRCANADFFLVQSPVVRRALAARLSGAVRILEAPFYVHPAPPAADVLRDPARWSRFAYVSDAYPHKNHATLIEAWRTLARRGLRPELHLTVYGPYPGVLRLVGRAQAEGVRIINHGFVDATELYRRCGYQVYPSRLESFGLGLVEAAESGCSLLAADLPYVREVVDPLATFDPLSPGSIADAVAAVAGRPAPASAVKVVDRIDSILAWLGGAPAAESF